MKTLLLLPLVLSIPAFAGTPVTSAKQTVAPPAPSCVTSWFVGGSVGYLTELDEPMYTLDLGVTNSCWNFAGWNTSLFLEVGYTQKDEDFNSDYDPEIITAVTTSNDDLKGDVDDLEDLLQAISDNTPYDTSYDLDIIPITLNVKFERAIAQNFNVYLGGGLGVARVSLDVDAGPFGDFSDDEWVFVGQIFGGVSYNISPAFQVYGGARWIWMDDADFSDGDGDLTLELGSDCLLEIGAKYTF